MKLFNLKKALAGDPVQTANGKRVKQLTLFDIDVPYNLAGVVDGDVRFWTPDGMSPYNTPIDDNFRLVMSPVKKTGWLNLYQWNDGQTAGIVFNSEEEAIEESKIFYTHKMFIKTIKIEWEE